MSYQIIFLFFYLFFHINSLYGINGILSVLESNYVQIGGNDFGLKTETAIYPEATHHRDECLHLAHSSLLNQLHVL